MVLLASAYDQSRFLKAADLEREKKFRVKSVTEEEVGERKERKLVVWFTNDEHGLVLNKTNNRTLRGAFGDNCEGWNGKVIAVFPTMVDMRGKMTAALRVRIPPPKQAAASAAPAPKPAPSGNGAAAASAAAAAAAAATPKPAAEVDPELADEPAKPLGDEMEDEIPFN
jgi:hypothetical protein